ncbi:MAG TPA: dipeptide ABC transporter ATP-binding protein [Acidimicrobiales bacterium]|nr:dipeptide ABC transporter ATP-binding protein [Acidimicrobiales bacterium]
MSTLLPPGSGDPIVDLGSEPTAEAREGSSGETEHRRVGALRRFARDKTAVGGLVFIVGVIFMAIAAPLLAPYGPNVQDLFHINAGPSGAHWLGTDDLGRDMLSRLIFGARPPLRAAFQIVGGALVLALPLALVAGFVRGSIDMVIMRAMDALFSFPPLVLALTVAGLLGPDLNDASIAIAIVFVPSFVRLIRGEVIAVREENYVEAARATGVAPGRLVRTHILPNVASPLIIQVALALGYAILIDAGLSFLGLGEQPPTASWGLMLTEAYRYIFSSPLTLVFPGLAILLTVLAFNLVADGLRDALGRERFGATRAARLAGGRRARRVAASAAHAERQRAAGEIDVPSSPELLTVEHLRVEFATRDGWLPVVEDVGFGVLPGRTLGLVGESGSGKTVSALAIMGLLPRRESRVPEGSVRFDGMELTELSAPRMRQIRGNDIAMIFQEPMTSLNPAFTVGNQIAEQVRAHREVSRGEAWARAVDMLDQVGIPDPTRRARDYPHAFSGGMRQRVMIAMALSCEPKLLIADEPTTALDVTTQAQILELLASLQQERHMAMIFVTHDLGVISDIADDVVVMYAGQVMERTAVGELFGRPHHPYSEALLASMPQLASPGSALKVIAGQVPRPDEMVAGCRFGPRCDYTVDGCRAGPVALEPTADSGGLVRCVRHGELALAGIGELEPEPKPVDTRAPETAPALLDVANLRMNFPVRTGPLRFVTGQVKAVDGVDLHVPVGRTVGLVGESGSGKSTLARLIVRLVDPSEGSIVLDGHDLTTLSGRELRHTRRSMQIVFQDPYSSLDPRMRVNDIVGEPLEIYDNVTGAERDERVAELLDQVGLGRYALYRRPHEFSGGQRQRIAIARALAPRPRLLVCDEPVSALDVSTQSQVINLLTDLQSRLGLAFLFIAHDLSVVRHISDRIAVMYLGRIVEEGDAEEVYLRPRHPYTEALLSAIPIPDVHRPPGIQRIVLTGEVANPLDPPTGCTFHPRCPYAMEICSTVEPQPFVTPAGTTVRCHLHTSGPVLDGRPITTVAPPGSAAPTSGAI